eukprot:gene6035-7839_t
MAGVRAAAQDVVQALTGAGGGGMTGPTEYIAVLRAALDTGDPRVVTVALDCIQKIMTFGYLSDSLPGSVTLAELAEKASLPLPPAVGEFAERK